LKDITTIVLEAAIQVSHFSVRRIQLAFFSQQQKKKNEGDSPCTVDCTLLLCHFTRPKTSICKGLLVDDI